MKKRKSEYGDRNTVGQIYLDAQKDGDKTPVIAGDLTNEMMKSLVDDLNDTIASDPFKGRSFYITVHESKDKLMPRMIRRRLIKTLYRPYPEDDTVVFWVDPKSNQTNFCWCLPHWSEMPNMLMSWSLFDKNLINSIRAWKALDLHHFGFCKDPMGNWIANPHYKNDLSLTPPMLV